MTIHLHFGTHKTGSTSIQQALFHGRLDEGHRYINFGQPNSSLTLRSAYRKSYDKIAKDTRGQPASPELIAAKRQSERSRVIAAIRDLPGNVNGIISAEAMSLMNEEELSQFRDDILENSNHSIQTIGYVRPPADYANSLVQQGLQRRFNPIEQMTINIRYRSSIGKFDRVFGRNKTRVFLYSPGGLKKNDIVKDFCKNIGCHVENHSSKQANKSLSLNGVRLLYVYRREYQRIEPAEANLISVLSELSDEKFSMTPELMLNITAWDAADFKWLSDTHGIDLTAHWPPDQGRVGCEADLLNLTDSLIEWAVDRMELKGSLSGLKHPEVMANALRQFVLSEKA